MGVEPFGTGCWRTGKAPGQVNRAFNGSFFAKDEAAKREYSTAFEENTVITP